MNGYEQWWIHVDGSKIIKKDVNSAVNYIIFLLLWASIKSVLI